MIIFWDDAAGVRRELWIDATETESPNLTGTLSRKKVDSGADITDHYRANPETVNFSCVITNTPLRAPQGITGSVQSVELPLRPNPIAGRAEFLASVKRGQVDTANVVTFDSEFDRVADAYKTLRQFWQQGTLLTFETSLGLLPNMIITGISPTRNADTGNALSFGLTAEAVEFADVEVVDAPVREPKQPRSQKKKPRGNQQTTEDPEPQETFLNNLFDLGSDAPETGRTAIIP